MKKLFSLLVGVILLSGLCNLAFGQTENQEKPDAKESPQSNWITSCSSTERNAPLNCLLEQRIIVKETGQLVVKLTVRIDGVSRKPALLIQAPLGLNLAAGIIIRVDDGKPEKLDLQMCDASGCYAGSPISNELLALLTSGTKVNFTFQNLAKKDLNFEMPLTSFSAAFQKVK
jgi:invasion protein IalB